MWGSYMWPNRKNKLDSDLENAVSAWLESSSESKATYRAYSTALSKWQGVIKSEFATAGESHARIFLNYMTNERKQSPKTVNGYFRALSALYGSLQRQGLVRCNPFPVISKKIKLEMSGTNPHVLIPFAKIKEALDNCYSALNKDLQTKCCIALLYGGGLRIDELRTLRLVDIDITEGEQGKEVYLKIRAEIAKGRKGREVHIPQWTHEYIFPWYNKRVKYSKQPEWSLIAKKLQEEPAVDQASIRRRVQQAFASVGITMTPHSLRGSAITHFLDAGITPREIKGWSGHSNTAIIEKSYDKRQFGREDSPWKKVEKNDEIKK